MTLDSSLDLLSLLGTAILLGLVVFKRIHKSLPFFSSYLLFLALVGAAPHVEKFNDAVRDRRVFLVLSVAGTGFAFLLLIELSISVLNPICSSSPGWIRLGVACWLALLFVSIWRSVQPPAFDNFTAYGAFVIRSDLAVSSSQVILLLALAAFSQSLKIPWGDREVQIAIGLGLYSSVSFLATLLQLHLDFRNSASLVQSHNIDRLQTIGWICLMIYWIVSFAQKVSYRHQFTPQGE